MSNIFNLTNSVRVIVIRFYHVYFDPYHELDFIVVLISLAYGT